MAVCSLQWIDRADYMDSRGICGRISHIELFFKKCLVKTHCAFECSGLESEEICINILRRISSKSK